MAQQPGSSSQSVVLASDHGEVDVNLAGTDVEFDLAANEDHIGEVGGKLTRVDVEFTRPANTTAYTAGDVVSNDATTTTPMAFANLARVNAGSGYIVAARLVTDKKSITPKIRVHLFNAADPTLSGDNVAHQEKYADIGKRIASFDLAAMTTATDTSNSDTSRASDDTLRVPFACAAASRTVYAVLEALDAFTPASGQKFTLTLIADNN